MGSQAQNHFVRWGTKMILRWDSPERLKEIGLHLQQWFGNSTFWNPIVPLSSSWIYGHPENHLIWLKYSPNPYRGFLVFFPYHGRNWSCLLLCGEQPGSYELYFLKFRLSTEIYKGTWWVVEMTQRQDNSYQVWLEDCWFLNGQDLRSMNVMERSQHSKKIWETSWQPDTALEAVELKWKPRFMASQFPQIFDFLRSKQFIPQVCNFWMISQSSNRDLVLSAISWWQPLSTWNITPILQALSSQQNKKIIQTTNDWKSDHCIFTLWKTKYPDIYELSSKNREGDHGTIYGYACIPNIQISLMVRNWFLESNKCAWIQAEWHPWFGRWVPTRLTKEPTIVYELPQGHPPNKFWFQPQKWFSYPTC